MTFIVAKHTAAGPVVTAGVAWDGETEAYALGQGTQPPTVISVEMLVDTGATISSLSGEVIRRLGLVARGATKLRTAGNNLIEDRPLYHVSLYLVDAQSASTHKVVPIIEYPARNDGLEGLLGWDVLQYCSIVYNKDTRLFSLDF